MKYIKDQLVAGCILIEALEIAKDAKHKKMLMKSIDQVLNDLNGYRTKVAAILEDQTLTEEIQLMRIVKLTFK